MTGRGRVAHVNPFSTVHTWLVDVVGGLGAEGWDATVVTLAPAGELHAALRAAGVTALSLDAPRRRDVPLAAARLARSLRGVDVVHAHIFDAALVSAVAAAITRTPLVVTRHEGPGLVRRAPGGGARRKLFHVLDRAVVRGASAIQAPSDLVRDELVALGARPERVHKILLGLDMARYASPDRAAALVHRRGLAPSGGPLVLAAGRLSWEKRFDVLLRAWPAVLRARPEAVLVIAGEGAERGRLAGLAGELGLDASVVLAGWRRDLDVLMLAADVVVQTSAIESTGLVVLEAMALGRPVVTTAVGVVNEYLRDGIHCAVVPHGDPDALAREIASVFADPDRAAAMGRAARDAVRERSRMDTMVAAYAELYGRVARHR